MARMNTQCQVSREGLAQLQIAHLLHLNLRPPNKQLQRDSRQYTLSGQWDTLAGIKT